MMIKIELFMVLYLVFSLLPALFSLTKKSPSPPTFRLIYLIIFCALAAALTGLSVSITKKYIFFSPASPPYRRLGLDLSLKNIFLNFALTFPLGQWLFFCVKKAPQRGFISSAVVGALFGLLIELIQLIFPLGRVVDPLDILLCAAGTLFSFLVARLINIAYYERGRVYR